MIFLACFITGMVVAYIEYCIMSKYTKDIKEELKEIKGLLYYAYGIEYNKNSGLLGKAKKIK